MREIKLTQGKTAWVDDDMFEELNQFKWYAHKIRRTYYADRLIWLPDEKRQITVRMNHSVIGFPPDGFVCDHRDGNGLNNQRQNLRFATYRQNCQNRQNVTFSSKYPGVGWLKRDSKWRAKIKINGISKYLGLFTSEQEAYQAYETAVALIGEKVIKQEIRT